MKSNLRDRQIEQQLKFSSLFGLSEAVSEDVLFAAIEDANYIHNLFISRKTPEFLNHLINNPPNIVKTPELTTDEIENIVSIWEKTLLHQETEKTFKDRYNKYFEADKVRDPGAGSCKPCAEINPQDFREVYLDHNSTTYIRPEVSDLLVDFYKGKYGFANPSNKTVQGDFTGELIFKARKQISNALYTNPHEIYFTGSGSEANNLAIKGVAFNYLEKKGHLITSKVEHSSVLRVMEYLEAIGFTVTYLDVNNDGMVSPESVKNAIDKNTILISIMAANNEIGTINPISEIGQICKESNIPFMVDAVQGFGKIPLNPKEMGISLLSISGHKIYAPKGIGALYVEDGTVLVPQVHGGGQESGLRAGTENVGSIMAFGLAAELIHKEMEIENKRLDTLKEYFLKCIKKIDNDIIINGQINNRLSNNLNIGFPGVDSGSLVRSLNRIGVSVSASSACNSRRMKTSHVLKAIGRDSDSYGSIRFSFGLNTNKEDIDYVLKYLDEILRLLRNKNL